MSEYYEAFRAYLRQGAALLNAEQRCVLSGGELTGGFLVPDITLDWMVSTRSVRRHFWSPPRLRKEHLSRVRVHSHAPTRPTHQRA